MCVTCGGSGSVPKRDYMTNEWFYVPCRAENCPHQQGSIMDPQPSFSVERFARMQSQESRQ
jgi:hypothetical protein